MIQKKERISSEQRAGILLHEFAPKVFQTIGIVDFILAFVQIPIGWFIGFFFSGLFFMMLKSNNEKSGTFNVMAGVACFLYSFHCLFTQVL
ncbi:hypothetical protein MOE68_17835 [Bacillus haynesii]|uniref:hypothetical protein n=1 Tax=Bacillus haynesii TaxID=1925021 RepID=UPI002281F78E|nr:hypothetical protein [Bacillus haynesii]MCY9182394.1 hypothetical protein [Bacillus haynesii]